MVTRTHRLLLTLVAAVAVTIAAAGCGPTLTGPGPTPPAVIQPDLAENPPVEIAITAIVTSVTDSLSLLAGVITVGDSVSGSLLYDEHAVDIDDKPDRGKYLFETAPFGMAIEIAGIPFRSDPGMPVFVIRLDNAEPDDAKRDSARFLSTANLPVFPGVGVADMTILLIDRSAEALSSDVLAGVDFHNTEWPTKRQLTITGMDGWQIVGEIDSIVDFDGEDRSDPPTSNKKIKLHRE